MHTPTNNGSTVNTTVDLPQAWSSAHMGWHGLIFIFIRLDFDHGHMDSLDRQFQKGFAGR